MLSPAGHGRVNGLGRIAFGVGMLAAPGASFRAVLGEDADRPGAQALIRMLGARDVLLGFLTAHTAGRPGVGARTMATVAAVDAVDAAAFTALRGRSAGPADPLVVVAIAAGSMLQLTLAARAAR